MMSGTSQGNWSSQKFQWRLLTSFEPERLPNPVVKELIAVMGRCGYTSQELPINTIVFHLKLPNGQPEWKLGVPITQKKRL
jgi:hypothetical protein